MSNIAYKSDKEWDGWREGEMRNEGVNQCINGRMVYHQLDAIVGENVKVLKGYWAAAFKNIKDCVLKILLSVC